MSVNGLPVVDTITKMVFNKEQVEAVLIEYFKNALGRPELANSNFTVNTNIDVGDSGCGIKDPLDYSQYRPSSISSIQIIFK